MLIEEAVAGHGIKIARTARTYRKGRVIFGGDKKIDPKIPMGMTGAPVNQHCQKDPEKEENLTFQADLDSTRSKGGG